MLRVAAGILSLGCALVVLVLLLAVGSTDRMSSPQPVSVGSGVVNVQATIELPDGYPRRYVNVDLDAERVGSDGATAIRRISIGEIALPGWLADKAVQWAFGNWAALRDERVIRAGIRALQSYPERLEVVCSWPRSPVEEVRVRGRSGDGREWPGTYGDRIAGWAAAGTGPRAPLLDLLRSVVSEAAGRTRAGADPAVENRAAIMVAAAHAFGCTPIAGGQAVRRVKPALHRRDDLGRHFLGSAALAAVLGRELSNSIGLDKEVSDARRISGFSFSDIAANRAGARFGDLATGSPDSARRVQEWMERATADTDIMPPVGDLPDHLSEEVLKQRFGDPGDRAYRAILDEIEARIAGIPLYRESK